MEDYFKQNYVIFCDFDGTITKKDTINNLFELFADKSWESIEKLWQNGLIGSKECLEEQIKCIKNISKDELDNYINQIEIDESFIDFMKFVQSKQIEFYIVSDGFSMIINKVLEKYKIKGLKIFSNNIEHKNNTLIPSFDYNFVNCETKAGLCKCNVIKENHNFKKIIYIGDGLSDICAAKFADILFAKDKLLTFAKKANMGHIPFSSFKGILSVLHKQRDVNNNQAQYSHR